MYETWKNSVLGQKIVTVGDVSNPNGVECVTVDWSWAFTLFPTVSPKYSISTGDAKTILDNCNPKYFEVFRNNGGATPDIELQQGDIAVFGATPADGFANQFTNPYGHTGVVDSWDQFGVTLVQQDGSEQQLPVQLKYRRFDYSPLLGVARPKGEQDMPTLVDQNKLEDAYQLGTGRTATGDDGAQLWLGKPLEELNAGLLNSDEHKQYDYKAKNYQAIAEALSKLQKQTTVPTVASPVLTGIVAPGLTTDQATSLNRIDNTVQWIANTIKSVFNRS